jgi:hypothetical protein
MPDPQVPKEAVEAFLSVLYPAGGYPDFMIGDDGLVVQGLQAAAPAIREQVFNELRRAAEALENDPSADPGTYIHDVECAILRLLEDSDA